MKLVKDKAEMKCYHCGESCSNKVITSGEKNFCCSGCKTVYEILNGNDLCNYYTLTSEAKPGIRTAKKDDNSKFDYLDDKAIQKRIIDFENRNLTTVTFYIPSVHCSSCIWLLEKLYKINPALISSSVNFPEKKLKLTFDNSNISLKDVVKVLASIGYEPSITTDRADHQQKNNNHTRKLYLKIGIAGFCLGNIMLLSFPEYLSMNDLVEGSLKTIFNYLNIFLSLPVFFCCASDYFISAFKGLSHKFINIDFPVSLGLTALFVRGLYETIFFNNPGFSDSLAGLVFLLLIGKLFQGKTYDALNFERDFKSYFPVSVTLKDGDSLKNIPIEKLKNGDRMIILNNEIVPADGILFKGTANIDYSFVTGESLPEQKVLGEIIYAGGKHLGSAIELEVVRTVSRSYLTRLWNDEAFRKKSEKNSHAGIQSLANAASKYFTAAILLIAFGAALYWYGKDTGLALNAFTTVLIIACPCAFALTTPFALGNAMRILGKNGFYLKNANVAEEISRIDTVVFDKTGTITTTKDISVDYTGTRLNLCEVGMVKSLVSNSAHPLSKAIYNSIKLKIFFEIKNFSESLSNGLSCEVSGKKIILGNLHYILNEIELDDFESIRESAANAFSTNVYLCIDKKIKGYFSLKNKYRKGLKNVISGLKKNYRLSVISGDNDFESANLEKAFGFENKENLLFNQTPSSKLNYIRSLQAKKMNVLMVGDGLNDAGALKQSNVGVSVTEDVSNFSPACDAILDASEFSKLGVFMKYCRSTVDIIKISFGISFLYNAIGLYIAAQGRFSPLAAAVLMPFNSISIILFVTGATNFIAKRRKLI